MTITESAQQISQNQIAPPKQYGVYLLNDDYTTMEFVVQILVDVFRQPEERAISVMLEIHHHGKGLCGVYTRDMAQTKQHQVMILAADAGFPLLCTVEELS
jgi:hypothetical protein|nr:ATP-dependent Clp protease adaptor ClpS [Simonsiella muelleri]